MRIAVVGAGAIGGYLAAKLALAGHDTSLLARGAQLEAIRRDGLTLVDHDGGAQHVRGLRASDRLADLGPQDLVLLALKAHQIATVAPGLAALGADTPVVAMQNGIPWWYFQRCGGPHEGHVLQSADPGGLIAAHLPPERVIGCVAFKAAEVLRPGVVRHTVTANDKFPLGELDGRSTARVLAASQALQEAGVAAPVVPDIRAEKWFKLLGNLAWNPICALTQATVSEVGAIPEGRELCLAMMREGIAVAASLGVTVRGSPETRMKRADEVGAVRPSMLQDTQAGRPLEVDALVGAVVELARLTRTPVPVTEAVHACARLLSSVIEQRGVRIAPQPLG
ncbi:ketopantoate reductase family protein [Aquabacterium sp. J223]|uniref:ketopantoate reductase family protein n=1 Tax=Aquabacterium sp. J223 TaxID=2898431 RepID=UPI0021ADCD90|nr:2-dehydropantoate 2-reductase [Aquabacterium sp. J223]UUX97330.1 2-dehydropantoate 2-reductase [Aquabacterium sp. J223]